MKLQCPGCKGYGLYKVKQSWWERLLRMERQYHCVDCQREWVRSQLNETDKLGID